MIGENEKYLAAVTQTTKVAASKLQVLLIGENGTGKEKFARLVHDHSERRDGPFITVNCSALPESLAESLLFGHTRGAFTGANQAKQGYIQAANNGTLFLDEIGEMPITLQPKLLRVLEDWIVTPVGDTHTTKVDVRLVCATNRHLGDEIKARRFREDLFHRIAGSIVRIPTLRERKSDIRLLATHFANGKGLSGEAIQALETHMWPGNIRELRNLIEQACVFAEGDIIQAHDLRFVDLRLAPLAPTLAETSSPVPTVPERPANEPAIASPPVGAVPLKTETGSYVWVSKPGTPIRHRTSGEKGQYVFYRTDGIVVGQTLARDPTFLRWPPQDVIAVAGPGTPLALVSDVEAFYGGIHAERQREA